jgi:hypothetical protein
MPLKNVRRPVKSINTLIDSSYNVKEATKIPLQSYFG